MLIGLCGDAQSGKDTACRFLQDRYPNIRRDAFADRLKLSAARALGLDYDFDRSIDFCNRLKRPGYIIQVVDPEGYVVHELTGRKYLQAYGTEAHREVFDQYFWIKAVVSHYEPSDSEVLVITDTRFENEAQAIRQLDGEIWKIDRPSLPKIVESSHASEHGISEDLVDRVIVNDSSLESFRIKVVDAFEDMKVGRFQEQYG